MAEYLIKGETLTAIADAIRSKTGETGIINPTQFVEKITNIESGGAIEDYLDTSDENLKYFSYNIDVENKQIILTSYLDAKKYAETGTYDIEVPDKIGGYSVVIDTNQGVT